MCGRHTHDCKRLLQNPILLSCECVGEGFKGTAPVGWVGEWPAARACKGT